MKTHNIARRSIWVAVAIVGLVAASRANAPAGRYTIANGTVYDTKTKLTWQQAIVAPPSSWSDAASYCASLALDGTGWRLPSAKELQTIVDESQRSPAIDPTAF